MQRNTVFCISDASQPFDRERTTKIGSRNAIATEKIVGVFSETVKSKLYLQYFDAVLYITNIAGDSVPVADSAPPLETEESPLANKLTALESVNMI